MSGPQSAIVGETAQFVIVLRNTGTQRLSKITVVDRFDPALEPTMASEGFSVSGNELAWKIEQVNVGETMTLGVHYRCLRESTRACNRVSVTTQEAAAAQTETCLDIRPAPPVKPPATPPPKPEPSGPSPSTPPASPPGELTMTVADLRDPVAAGKEVTYEIRVTNRGPGPDRQVALAVTLPLGMQPVPLGTIGPGGGVKTEGQVIHFDPVAELPPGQTLTYRVRVRTQQPGDWRLRAELTSRATSRPIVVEESTQVF